MHIYKTETSYIEDNFNSAACQCCGNCQLWAPEQKIHVVRQKRAACRAWVIPSHERICENCAHEGTHPYATPCSECFRCPFAQAYDGFSDNWEPRKEGHENHS